MEAATDAVAVLPLQHAYGMTVLVNRVKIRRASDVDALDDVGSAFSNIAVDAAGPNRPA